jgi:fatty-acyl-CoA synthase
MVAEETGIIASSAVAQGDGIYDQPYLARNTVNFAVLTPLAFLIRAAEVYPDKCAVVYGPAQFTYRQLYDRCRQLADALRGRGIRAGDTVAVMAPNVPALLEAHYGVPMAGAVLNALNYHLDARSIAFILRHGEAKLLIVDREFAPIVAAAVSQLSCPIPLVEIDDSPAGASLGGTEYEAFLREGNPAARWDMPHDEWQSIALSYTSGTTGNPKGVVYHHRGAYLSAIGNAMTFGLDRSSVYLWTLPMFHCNGWGFTWAVTVVAGTHVCLRRADPASIFSTIAEHRVTHLCGAPIVLNLLVHAPEQVKRRFSHVVEIATGGAAPPSTVIERMEHMGFRVTHLYGLTESYGPSTVCAWQEDWAGLPIAERAALMARQGVPNLMLSGQRVVDPKTMTDVPADGAALGELVLRGNTLMKGYLKNPEATEQAFAGGWFHTGDLAVQHPDSYIEIKDRSKDIIIVGGDNLSSLEVEHALYRHPRIMEAAVIAKPDPVCGEIPCAFVTLKPDTGPVSSEDIIGWCRHELAEFKVPRIVVFGSLPKTATGKIQKFELRERAKEIAVRPNAPQEVRHLHGGDALERRLATIWAQLLKVKSVGATDNFFSIGGDSLLALRLAEEIEEVFTRTVPLDAIFSAPTIAELAKLIERDETPATGFSLVPLQTAGTRPPVFLIHWIHRNFVQHLGSARPVYGLSYGLAAQKTSHGSIALPPRLEDMAAQYLDEMRSVQPRGPYFLIGYSVGGFVAFEMARQLRERGENVGFLGLLDTRAPGDYTLERYPLHRQIWNLFRLPASEHIEYLRYHFIMIRSRLRPRYPETVAGVGNLLEESRARTTAYIPKPFSGRLTFFKAKGVASVRYRQPAPELAWGALATGGIEVREVAGRHRSMITGRNARMLAAEVLACLDRGDRAQAGPPVDIPTAARCEQR